jgi:hypothetical protein
MRASNFKVDTLALQTVENIDASVIPQLLLMLELTIVLLVGLTSMLVANLEVTRVNYLPAYVNSINDRYGRVAWATIAIPATIFLVTFLFAGALRDTTMWTAANVLIGLSVLGFRNVIDAINHTEKDADELSLIYGIYEIVAASYITGGQEVGTDVSRKRQQVSTKFNDISSKCSVIAFVEKFFNRDKFWIVRDLSENKQKVGMAATTTIMDLGTKIRNHLQEIFTAMQKEFNSKALMLMDDLTRAKNMLDNDREELMGWEINHVLLSEVLHMFSRVSYHNIGWLMMIERYIYRTLAKPKDNKYDKTRELLINCIRSLVTNTNRVNDLHSDHASKLWVWYINIAMVFIDIIIMHKNGDVLEQHKGYIGKLTSDESSTATKLYNMTEYQLHEVALAIATIAIMCRLSIPDANSSQTSCIFEKPESCREYFWNEDSGLMCAMFRKRVSGNDVPHIINLVTGSDVFTVFYVATGHLSMVYKLRSIGYSITFLVLYMTVRAALAVPGVALVELDLLWNTSDLIVLTLSTLALYIFTWSTLGHGAPIIG